MHSTPFIAECARACRRPARGRRCPAGGRICRFLQCGFRQLNPSYAARKHQRHFVFAALRETHELVVGAVGEARARELRRIGAVMGVDETFSYALSNIDPKLLSRPIASIDR